MEHTGFLSPESKRRFRLIASAAGFGALFVSWAAIVAIVLPQVLRRSGREPDLGVVKWFFLAATIENLILPTLLALVLSAPIRRHRTVEVAPNVRVAPLWRRCIAKAVDGVLILTPLVIVQALVILPRFESGDISHIPQKGLILLSLGLIWGLATGLLTIFYEGRTGRSVGKSILGIRALREDLTPCGFGRALARNLVGFIDGLWFGLVGVLVAAVTARYQRVGDLAARTVVVQDSTT